MTAYQGFNPADPKDEVFLSECGRFYAVRAPRFQPAYDVVEVGGGRVWLDREFTLSDHAPFSRMVVSWHNQGCRARGAWKDAFDLGFVDLDRAVKVRPGEGNAITANYEACFRRKARLKRSERQKIAGRIQAFFTAEGTP